MEASVSGMPCDGLNASFSEYNGLVPMSPNTTPIAAMRERGQRLFGSARESSCHKREVIRS